MAAATTTQPPRSGRAERERMLELFERLCAIESPSLGERAVADAVAEEMRDIGLEVTEDESAAETGSEAGNLRALVEAPAGTRTILLCAHLDTVPLDAPIEVARSEGFFVNRNEAILGADNKAAVATILAAVRSVLAQGDPAVGLELVFTTCEEIGLRGAKALDRETLASQFGFVFDHASPIGEVIVAAPTHFRIEGDFHGQAAHAGIRPEDGRNAISAAAAAIARLELGRLDAETTANVGRIEGGTAGNVVAERCHVELEARSLDAGRAATVAQTMVDTLTAAGSEFDCDVQTGVDELFRGYRLSRGAPPVAAAATALERLGVEPAYVTTGGGSDANALIAAGLPCVNVANGTERNHQPDERVSVAAIETMLDVTLGIIAASAEPSA